MPRVSTKAIEESTKTAPKKRAVRRVSSEGEKAKETKRRVVSKNVDTRETPTRKAPTGLSEVATKRGKKRKIAFLMTGIVFLVFALAAFIGNSDKGPINVNAKIDEESKRRPQATESVDGNGTVTLPVQNTPPAAISGLRGQGVGTKPIETPTPEVEEATTTEDLATSTEPVAEEVTPENN